MDAPQSCPPWQLISLRQYTLCNKSSLMQLLINDWQPVQCRCWQLDSFVVLTMTTVMVNAHSRNDGDYIINLILYRSTATFIDGTFKKSETFVVSFYAERFRHGIMILRLIHLNSCKGEVTLSKMFASPINRDLY